MPSLGLHDSWEWSGESVGELPDPCEYERRLAELGYGPLLCPT